jgi:hypothetical protein
VFIPFPPGSCILLHTYSNMESIDLNTVKLRDPSDAEVRENSF